ncbi:MAG: hypothetical protein RIT45_2465 [Pseudomonadota bacterium]
MSEPEGTAAPIDPRWPWLVGALTAAVLGVVAAPVPGFLDAGELIAAARELGVIHPPGHPAWLSLAGLAELLPFGPIAARVAWLSAIFGGVAAGLTVRISARLTAAAQADAGAVTAGAIVAGATLCASGSLWLVGSRAEVYTLALVGNLWALDAALQAGDAATRGRRGAALRAGVGVAIGLALGLLNHHYVTLFAVPAVLAAAWPALGALRARPRTTAALVGVAALLGLGYLALPLRAASGTGVRWGDPLTLAGFWDHLTAAHFQRSVTETGAGGLGAALDAGGLLLFGIVRELGVALGAVGVAGVVLLGLRPGHRAATVWLALLGGLATKALMSVDLRNPDDHGYVLLAVTALAIGSGSVTTAVAAALRRVQVRTGGLAPAAMLLLVAGNIAPLLASPDHAPWDQRAPDRIDDALRERTMPGGLLLTTYYATQFGEAAFRLAEGRRPDLCAAHLSMGTGFTDGGRGWARWFVAAHPDHAALALGAQANGRAPIGNVLALGEQRRVVAELDPDNRIPPPFYDVGAVGHRLLPERERKLDYVPGELRTRAARDWKALSEALGPIEALDHPSRAFLVWQHSLEAAHALRRGWMGPAEDAIARARAIAPLDASLGALEARLATLKDAWKRGDAKAYGAAWQAWSRLTLDEMLRPPLR